MSVVEQQHSSQLNATKRAVQISIAVAAVVVVVCTASDLITADPSHTQSKASTTPTSARDALSEHNTGIQRMPRTPESSRKVLFDERRKRFEEPSPSGAAQDATKR